MSCQVHPRKWQAAIPQHTDDATYSKSVAKCPGYTPVKLSESTYGLTAQLSLAGEACNAFGTDITDLTIEVTYQSTTTLHVKIYGTANQQFTIPDSVIERPQAPTESFTGASGLVFNYESSPFALSITRRADPDAMPMFDTRTTSLPLTPMPPLNSSDPSTGFDGFPLVFEDQYLQITSALPYGTNIHGLGEVIASSGLRRDIGTNGGVGTIQTLWTRDSWTPVESSFFPDWFAENTQGWWTQALQNWTGLGVDFSGIWLDMNEPSSFCTYSCGTGANFSAPTPFSVSGIVVDGYPECYNYAVGGSSGNMTVDGTSTNSCVPGTTKPKRGVGAGGEKNVNSHPPYAIHNANGALSVNTVAANATHHGGYVDLDGRNLMDAKATHLALQAIRQVQRSFFISRSTFLSSGKWTGHWLGDDYGKWQYMYLQGILQFQISLIPMVGADTCGFNGNTDEEPCNRWMQLSAFTPSYRNHNTYGAIPQEPYRWDSVANASRNAITARYTMIPYWYTLFANASTQDLPPVRALFYEFLDEPELFTVGKQRFVGSDILVTPVLEPGATTVDGIFPGRGSVIWHDWRTYAVVNANSGATTTLGAPISHIDVRIRDSSILLLHQQPVYTIYETREGPYSLLVSLNKEGAARGDAYVDDGESYPPGPNRTLTFVAGNGELTIESTGEYLISQSLETITVLGVPQRRQPQ